MHFSLSSILAKTWPKQPTKEGQIFHVFKKRKSVHEDTYNLPIYNNRKQISCTLAEDSTSKSGKKSTIASNKQI